MTEKNEKAVRMREELLEVFERFVCALDCVDEDPVLAVRYLYNEGNGGVGIVAVEEEGVCSPQFPEGVIDWVKRLGRAWYLLDDFAFLLGPEFTEVLMRHGRCSCPKE